MASFNERLNEIEAKMIKAISPNSNSNSTPIGGARRPTPGLNDFFAHLYLLTVNLPIYLFTIAYKEA